MSKKITISNRINLVLTLVAIFLLILGTNRVDQSHFETAQKAITSVYNDRVLAQHYIYKLNNLIHKKHQLLMKDSKKENQITNKDIETQISLFADTKLTVNESRTFENFKNNFEELKIMEERYYEQILTQPNNKTFGKVPFKTPFDDGIQALQSDLNNLALIQVSETKSITGMAQKSFDLNKLISNMEIYFLFFIATIIFIIIFYRTGKSNEKNNI